ncbi:hypothetical protein PR048_024620 [Dryococelus australis]|uniref:PiggyBac transposable element-derived protein domain-containing protein n=1 Tax=Dryococelus australis TaxID=614101 RepID=A0ABQ9GP26_9NEOP|nr:hypothetical protein PR048_024620 [Dryococelus australis]
MPLKPVKRGYKVWCVTDSDTAFVLTFEIHSGKTDMMILLQNRIYSIGTVRVNRKGLPDILKTNDKLQRGGFMFSVKGPVAAMKWQDSKTGTVLPTATSPKDTTSTTWENKNGT